MESQFTTKSGFYGDQLIAYLNQCLACGREEKAYFAFASKEMQELMRRDELSGTKANCPDCRATKGLRDTCKWLGRVPRMEADADLAILKYGNKIDFDAVDAQIKHDEHMEVVVADNEKRVNEYLSWKRKKV